MAAAAAAVAAGRVARAATAKPASATVATVPRARDRGRGTACLWSTNPRVAPSRGPASIPAEPGREDGVVALACAMRTPADPQSEIKGTIYGIKGIAPGFLRDRRPWVDLSADGGDEAGTSSGGNVGETGTWRSVDDDGRFPSLVDLFLRHGGSLETIQEFIRGIKACIKEEIEN